MASEANWRALPIGARVVVRWCRDNKFYDVKGKLLEITTTDVVIATDSKNFEPGTVVAIPLEAIARAKAIPPRPQTIGG